MITRTNGKYFAVGILVLGALLAAAPQSIHAAFITDVDFNVTAWAVDRQVGVKNVGIPFDTVTEFSGQQLSRASASYYIPTADQGSMGAHYDFSNTASSAIFSLSAQFNLLTSGANLATIRTYTVDGSETPLAFTTTQSTFYFAPVSQIPFGPVNLLQGSNMHGFTELATSGNGGQDIFNFGIDNSSTARFGLLPASTRINFVGDLDSTVPGVSTVSLALAPVNGTSTPAAPVMPILVENGLNFVFNVDGQRVYVDSAMAKGYDYIADGGQTFASVLLPGTGNYSLFLWNGTEWVFDSTIQAGTEHLFGAGVDRFRISGSPSISAAFDLNNRSDFVTGLTFHNNGVSSMHMLLLSPVPLPSTMILFGVGLVSLGYLVFRNQSKNLHSAAMK